MKDTNKKKESEKYKKDIKEKPSSTDTPSRMIVSTIKSDVFTRVVGVFFVLFSAFLIISFVSFFLTWGFDYDKVKALNPIELIKGDKDIQNWGGPLGAFFSYIFIVGTFGVAAFGFLFLFIIIGLRLFGIVISRFAKTIYTCLIIMLWTSSVLGFFVYVLDLEVYQELAGNVGIAVNSWLHAFSGKVGAAITLMFFTITLPMMLFGVRYSFLKKIFVAKPKFKENKTVLENNIVKEQATDRKEEGIDTKDEEIEQEDNVVLENLKDNDINLKPTDITKRFVNKDGLTEQEEQKMLDFEIKISPSQNVQEYKNDFPVNQHSMPQQEEVQVKTEDSKAVIKEDIIRVLPIKEEVEISQNYDSQFISKAEIIIQKSIEIVDKKEKEIEFEIESNNDVFAKQIIEEDLLDEDTDSYQLDIKRNSIDTQYDPRLELSSFQFPSTDMLINYEDRNKEVSNQELVANKERIVETLKNYNIDIVKIVASPGPTVTLYEIVPAPGIRISKIKNLEDDIALSLAALGIRIIAPIPGKGTIGIEVPNQNPQIVSMKTMLQSNTFINSKFELPIAIGKTISNEPFVADLAKMPHLLMAGATGQGKSVGLNAIISSLLYRKHPAELKFVMVDPKKVELSLYNKIERHYLAKLPDTDEAIITDTRKVVRTLNSLCIEMDQRYDLLKHAQVKQIKEYNAKFISRRLNPLDGHRYMPYIVLVVDEFADLIMTAGKEVELPIARLAQLARAVGIHLIIATQRPSVNIITGTIKANFPARIAFRVTSKIDSRTILDTAGAEQLIGRGDMLLSTGNDIVRLQCALIDTEEIEQVAEFIGSQRGYPETFLLPEYIDENSEPSKDFDPKQIDDKFEEAARIIVALQHGSTSIIQRKLSLGYNRAGRIIDQLEAAGIVGPFEGSKAREVKVKSEIELEEILKEYFGR